MKVKVKEVRPNPHRDFKINPINEDRVEKFMESIKDNGFWENIVGRESDGEIQLAYGHHRLSALKRLYGEDYEFDLRIINFSDEQMLHVMIDENDDYSGNISDVIDEAVSVAKIFLEENIEIAKEYGDIDSRHERVSGNTLNIGERTITHFLQQVSKGKDLKKGSSWNLSKVKRSLQRMSAYDDNILSKEAVRELPSETHASEFAQALKSSKTKFTPKEQKQLANEISTKEMGKRDVRSFVEVKAFEKKAPKQKSTEPKKDSRIVKFEHKILLVTHEISQVTNLVVKLTTLHEEIKNINTKKGIWNVESMLAGIGKHMRVMNRFVESLRNDNEISEEQYNNFKQLK